MLWGLRCGKFCAWPRMPMMPKTRPVDGLPLVPHLPRESRLAPTVRCKRALPSAKDGQEEPPPCLH